MPNFGPTSIVVLYDDATGTPQDVSGQILTDPVVIIEAMMETQTEGYGAEWEENVPIGKRKSAPISLEFYHNDAADHIDTYLGEPVSTVGAVSRTLSVAYGAKTHAVETHFMKRTPVPSRTALTRMQAELMTTGLVTVT